MNCERCSFDAETHTYRMDGQVVPSVTGILKEIGLIDDRFYTDEGKVRGTAVHAAAHYLDEGTLDWASVHPTIEPFLRAYEKFKKESGFQPILVETQVCNHYHRYRGTLDRTGMLNGKEILLDIKSGAVSSWAALQLAAYNECLPKRLERYALQLKNDGNYKLIHFKDPNDRNIFLGAVSIVHWKTNNGVKHGNESRIAA